MRRQSCANDRRAAGWHRVSFVSSRGRSTVELSRGKDEVHDENLLIVMVLAAFAAVAWFWSAPLGRRAAPDVERTRASI
jgi:hypothetical protein